MDNREFDELGDKIQDIIDKAINSQNYQKLNQNISQTVNKAIDTGSEALKNALNSAFSGGENSTKKYDYVHINRTAEFEAKRKRERELEKEKKKQELSLLYDKPTGTKAAGIAMAAVGGSIAGSLGLTSLILYCVWTATGAGALGPVCAFLAAGAAVGAGILAGGCKRLAKTKRFRRYLGILGENTYCDFKQLSDSVEKPVKFVKKDIKEMIKKGWFVQGHIDKQETCLITSNETYRQYEEAQKQLELRTREEAARAERAKTEREKVSPQVQDVLDRGNEYLRKIRMSNDAIPGEEISAKISRMEMIVEKIFERAESHPEIIPDLKKLMNYYLPMTVKLLDAYEDMDRQPVQGENITSSKKEIEATLDTLNLAFEKLLDSVFQDAAWDISSDISVLHTMLAQEGLTEDGMSGK